ncbi:MAG TPA: divalent-cation tolerance protein CutA [Acidobacteriota bacterium]|nr:divalent-cation tolerance protein CutA [Acidobacteriota bacterium]
MSNETRIILSTIDDQSKAEEIATSLVSERLASCVNILPRILSIYRWKGQIKKEPETLLIIKTRGDRVDEVISRVAEIHPYEVPEVISLPIEKGHQPYLDWVLAESSAQQSDD